MYSFQDDFGAPLMCSDPTTGTWTLHGLLTRQGSCGGSAVTHPDVYTSVPDIKGWILSSMGRDAN